MEQVLEVVPDNETEYMGTIVFSPVSHNLMILVQMVRRGGSLLCKKPEQLNFILDFAGCLRCQIGLMTNLFHREYRLYVAEFVSNTFYLFWVKKFKAKCCFAHTKLIRTLAEFPPTDWQNDLGHPPSERN